MANVKDKTIALLTQKTAILEKQLNIAKIALSEISEWNDDLADEYHDESQRANTALININMLDGF